MAPSQEERRRLDASLGRLDSDQSPWSEYRRLVISELERLNDTLDRIQGELSAIKTEVALLKFKASVWGVAAGAISGAIVTIGAILLRGGSLN